MNHKTDREIVAFTKKLERAVFIFGVLLLAFLLFCLAGCETVKTEMTFPISDNAEAYVGLRFRSNPDLPPVYSK
jgi:hypothetical protein